VKSQVSVFFNEWLDLMQEAYDQLTSEQFAELEEKILTEIKHARKNKP